MFSPIPCAVVCSCPSTNKNLGKVIGQCFLSHKAGFLKQKQIAEMWESKLKRLGKQGGTEVDIFIHLITSNVPDTPFEFCDTLTCLHIWAHICCFFFFFWSSPIYQNPLTLRMEWACPYCCCFLIPDFENLFGSSCAEATGLSTPHT